MKILYKIGFPDQYKPEWCEVAFYLHDWEVVIRNYVPQFMIRHETEELWSLNFTPKLDSKQAE